MMDGGPLNGGAVMHRNGCVVVNGGALLDGGPLVSGGPLLHGGTVVGPCGSGTATASPRTECVGRACDGVEHLTMGAHCSADGARRAFDAAACTVGMGMGVGACGERTLRVRSAHGALMMGIGACTNSTLGMGMGMGMGVGVGVGSPWTTRAHRGAYTSSGAAAAAADARTVRTTAPTSGTTSGTPTPTPAHHIVATPTPTPTLATHPTGPVTATAEGAPGGGAGVCSAWIGLYCGNAAHDVECGGAWGMGGSGWGSGSGVGGVPCGGCVGVSGVCDGVGVSVVSALMDLGGECAAGGPTSDGGSVSGVGVDVCGCGVSGIVRGRSFSCTARGARTMCTTCPTASGRAGGAAAAVTGAGGDGRSDVRPDGAREGRRASGGDDAERVGARAAGAAECEGTRVDVVLGSVDVRPGCGAVDDRVTHAHRACGGGAACALGAAAAGIVADGDDDGVRGLASEARDGDGDDVDGYKALLRNASFVHVHHDACGHVGAYTGVTVYVEDAH